MQSERPLLQDQNGVLAQESKIRHNAKTEKRCAPASMCVNRASRASLVRVERSGLKQEKGDRRLLVTFGPEAFHQ